jgi:hypothetical protein
MRVDLTCQVQGYRTTDLRYHLSTLETIVVDREATVKLKT